MEVREFAGSAESNGLLQEHFDDSCPMCRNDNVAAGVQIKLNPVWRSSISAWHLFFKISKVDQLSHLVAHQYSKDDPLMVTRHPNAPVAFPTITYYDDLVHAST